VTDAQNPEPLLTIDQSYLAAYHFIRQFYERDARKPESMFLLLSWMTLEAPRTSSDPAQWHDWLGAVAKAVTAGMDGAFTEALSEPISK
jgi:hypothetical protein